jgi:hypothetical protein
MKTPAEERLFERNLAQILDALTSPVNRWHATEALGHEPDEQELVLWFIENGGATDFARMTKTER